ncbi:MAG: RNA polymerase sigma-70 factor [Prolixibacteraceae bacterium]|nr:RNA polymerase sigma-70 factor [Prolixibacteraceae bacterium]MBT6763055.1 RNA polymerase sigma-70 factor [Prolixibacteraceae bacterium]MBT6998702.1 RNA polymerase sigma-70 factor [Prolixibacteraceae bacterium]MBT7397503.1 RNA polymerase sigma-70 factor [Prolixibacteraceae bacterium]
MKTRDHKIIKGIKAGRESSYNQLFNEYYISLSLFAAKYVNDLDTAKEVVQDFFVHLFEIRDSLIITTSLESYLFQSVRNRCLNHIKHIQLNEKHLDNIKISCETNNNIEDKFREAELEYQIFRVVKKLPLQCNKIFRMSRIDGNTNQEIAETLNISKRTVETQISKALKILRNSLKDYFKT